MVHIGHIYFATRHVVIADWLFTTPAIIVQLLSGLWMMYLASYDFTKIWLVWGLILYFVTGACWLPVVWMQIKMRDMAKIAYDTGTPCQQLIGKWTNGGLYWAHWPFPLWL